MLWAYLSHSLPSLDIDSLHNLKETIQQLRSSSEKDEFLKRLSQYPIAPMASYVPQRCVNGRLVLTPAVYLDHLKNNVLHDIIAPDCLHWKDGGHGWSVSQLCERSLQEIQNRFEQ